MVTFCLISDYVDEVTRSSLLRVMAWCQQGTRTTHGHVVIMLTCGLMGNYLSADEVTGSSLLQVMAWCQQGTRTAHGHVVFMWTCGLMGNYCFADEVIGSLLLQVMAWCQNGTKPLPESIIITALFDYDLYK